MRGRGGGGAVGGCCLPTAAWLLANAVLTPHIRIANKVHLQLHGLRREHGRHSWRAFLMKKAIARGSIPVRGRGQKRRAWLLAKTRVHRHMHVRGRVRVVAPAVVNPQLCCLCQREKGKLCLCRGVE